MRPTILSADRLTGRDGLGLPAALVWLRRTSILYLSSTFREGGAA
jgi:hypothetical protein